MKFVMQKTTYVLILFQLISLSYLESPYQIYKMLNIKEYQKKQKRFNGICNHGNVP